MSIDAAEIRVRAERWLGELIKAQKETGAAERSGWTRAEEKPEWPVSQSARLWRSLAGLQLPLYHPADIAERA